MRMQQKNLAPIFLLVLIIGTTTLGIISFLNLKQKDTLPVDNKAANTVTTSALTDRALFAPKVYVSKKLGIQFSYLENKSDKPNSRAMTAEVKEVGNRVYVYPEFMNPSEGQFVEVLTKDKSASIEGAIQKQLLNGYSSQDCIIKRNTNRLVNLPSSYVIAYLNYAPKLLVDKAYPSQEDKTRCPSPYVYQDLEVYFLVDTNHPDKLLFFQVGGYRIDADDPSLPNRLSWQDTIELLD